MVIASCALDFTRIGCDRHDRDAGEANLVHHLGHHAGVRFPVGDDHDGVVGPLDVQPLHLRTHFAQLDTPPIHPNVAVLANRNHQVAGISIDTRHRRRLEDRHAGLLDERRGDDEENQQIHGEVEHRCKVDARVFGLRGVSSRLH
jgi:hypothetical protein